MRTVLSTREYERIITDLSPDEVRAVAAAVVKAAGELMAEHGLERAAFLFDRPMRSIALLSAQMLTEAGKETSAALVQRDGLPDLNGSLIVDLLFASSQGETDLSKRETWIKAMICSGCPVLSVGIPAGVEPDTGRVENFAVRAKITVAPGSYLPGLFLHDGLDHCGEIHPVGRVTETVEGLARFEETDAVRLLPPRKRTAHKGDSGRALLCVGSPKYVGAALLSARACMAAGCGILFVACPDVVRSALTGLPEAIGIPVGPEWNTESCIPAIQALADKQAVGIGCGMGDGDISLLIERSLESGIPLVLDADGLNGLSRHPELFSLLHEKVVLTPHPGEMSRLTGLSHHEVLNDPVALAENCARRWGCTVLLKGATTVVSDGQRTRLVAEGNAGLGKGGSGDVLTGIITGLLSQGIEPFAAACLGSWLLGVSAAKAFALLKERMLRATNVIEALEDRN